jgi:hypothetical protein
MLMSRLEVRRHWQGGRPSKAIFTAQCRAHSGDPVHNGTILKATFTIMNKERYGTAPCFFSHSPPA